MINFGIVGLGRIGKVHLSNLQSYCPQAKVIAASPVKSKHKVLLEEYGIVHHCETFEEMMEVPNLDAVVIASPTAYHYDHILQAAKAGKHIFCEKPNCVLPTRTK